MAPRAPATKRVGAKRNRRGNIPGADVAYDPELDYDKDRPTPSPLFPDFSPTPPSPPTPLEHRRLHHVLTLRSQTHQSPYYITLSSSTTTNPIFASPSQPRVQKPNHQSNTSKSIINDPFKGMNKYSHRYHTPPTKATAFKNAVLEFFPLELRRTVDPTYRPHKPAAQGKAVKRVVDVDGMGMGGTTIAEPPEKLVADTGGYGSDSEEEDVRVQSFRKQRLGGGDKEGGNDGGGEEEEEEEEEGLEAGIDDQFDDEEDAGDYDAEQYFDAGDEGGGVGGLAMGFEGGGEGSGYFD